MSEVKYRNYIVLCKDVSPNYCSTLYFVPSKFMDLCRKQYQKDRRAFQVRACPAKSPQGQRCRRVGVGEDPLRPLRGAPPPNPTMKILYANRTYNLSDLGDIVPEAQRSGSLGGGT